MAGLYSGGYFSNARAENGFIIWASVSVLRTINTGSVEDQITFTLPGGMAGSGIEFPMGGELIRTCPDRPWGSTQPLVSLPGVMHPGCGTDHSLPSSAEVTEYSYTSTPLTGLHVLFDLYFYQI